NFYEPTADIQAPPEAIWAVLTDAPGMTGWDSGVERVEGTIAPGAKIKVHVKANPGRAFPVKGTGWEPARRMVWSGACRSDCSAAFAPTRLTRWARRPQGSRCARCTPGPSWV